MGENFVFKKATSNFKLISSVQTPLHSHGSHGNPFFNPQPLICRGSNPNLPCVRILFLLATWYLIMVSTHKIKEIGFVIGSALKTSKAKKTRAPGVKNVLGAAHRVEPPLPKHRCRKGPGILGPRPPPDMSFKCVGSIMHQHDMGSCCVLS